MSLDDTITEVPEVPQLPETQSVAVVDSFMQELRSLVGGLPEDMTRDQAADFLVEMHKRSTEADTLRQQMEQFQAQQALAAHQASQTAAPPVNATPAQKRQWEAMQVDPQYLQFVKPDPSGPGYVPLNPLNGTHIPAAERMNAKAQRDANFTRAFVDDPYKTAAELIQDKLDEYAQKLESRFGELEQKMTPLQKLIAEQEQERKLAEFSTKHASVLFNADGTLTAIGETANEQYLKGVDPEEALAYAVKVESRYRPQAAGPTPAAPISISKVSQQKPTRFVDTLSAASRLPVDKPEFAAEAAKHEPTMKELQEWLKTEIARNK